MHCNIVKIKKLAIDAIIPTYAHPGDSGLDLCALHDYELPINGRVRVSTGISIQLPNNIEGQIRPRSGLSWKHGVVASFGTIDSTYTGELMVVLFNLGDSPFSIKKGDKIAQLVISSFITATIRVVDELSPTERGDNGFGSTGISSI